MFRSNSSWNKTFQKGKISTCSPDVITYIDELSTFMIRWERWNSVSQKKYSSDVILTEDVTVGIVNVDLPLVHVFRNKMCSDIERVAKYFL